MITNFEEFTYDLTEVELNILVPRIVEGLRKRIGKRMVITNKEICAQLSREGYKISTPRFRKILHYIRSKHLVKRVIATSKGYYVATTAEEIKEYTTSLHERAMSILSIHAALSKDMEEINQYPMTPDESHKP